MRRRFTRDVAAEQLRHAREEGRLWGLNHGLEDSPPLWTGPDLWADEVRDAWWRGMRDGREQRRRELQAVCDDV